MPVSRIPGAFDDTQKIVFHGLAKDLSRLFTAENLAGRNAPGVRTAAAKMEDEEEREADVAEEEEAPEDSRLAETDDSVLSRSKDAMKFRLSRMFSDDLSSGHPVVRNPSADMESKVEEAYEKMESRIREGLGRARMSTSPDNVNTAMEEFLSYLESHLSKQLDQYRKSGHVRGIDEDKAPNKKFAKNNNSYARIALESLSSSPQGKELYSELHNYLMMGGQLIKRGIDPQTSMKPIVVTVQRATDIHGVKPKNKESRVGIIQSIGGKRVGVFGKEAATEHLDPSMSAVLPAASKILKQESLRKPLVMSMEDKYVWKRLLDKVLYLVMGWDKLPPMEADKAHSAFETESSGRYNDVLSAVEKKAQGLLYEDDTPKVEDIPDRMARYMLYALVRAGIVQKSMSRSVGVDAGKALAGMPKDIQDVLEPLAGMPEVDEQAVVSAVTNWASISTEKGTSLSDSFSKADLLKIGQQAYARYFKNHPFSREQALERLASLFRKLSAGQTSRLTNEKNLTKPELEAVAAIVRQVGEDGGITYSDITRVFTRLKDGLSSDSSVLAQMDEEDIASSATDLSESLKGHADTATDIVSDVVHHLLDTAYSGGSHLTELRKEREGKSAASSLEAALSAQAAKKPFTSAQEVADVLKEWAAVVEARELDLDLKRHLPQMASDIYKAVEDKAGEEVLKSAKPVINAWLLRSRKEEVDANEVPNVVYVSSNAIAVGEGQTSTPVNMIPGRTYHLYMGPASRWSERGGGGGMNYIDLLVQDGTHATPEYEKSLGTAEIPKFIQFASKSFVGSGYFGKDVASTVETDEDGRVSAHELLDSNDVMDFHRSMMGDGSVEETFREFSKGKTPLQIMAMMGTLDSETRGALEHAYAGYNKPGDLDNLLQDSSVVRDFHQKTLKEDHADTSGEMKNEIIQALPSTKDMYSELSTMTPEAFLETLGGTREVVKVILDMVFPDSGMTFVHDKRSVDAAVKAAMVQVMKNKPELLDIYADLPVGKDERYDKRETGSVLHTHGFGTRQDIIGSGFTQLKKLDFHTAKLSKNGSRFLTALEDLRKGNPELFHSIFLVTDATDPKKPGNQSTGPLYNEDGTDVEHKLLVRLKDSTPAKGASPKDVLRAKRSEMARNNLVREYTALTKSLAVLQKAKLGREYDVAEDTAERSSKFLDKVRKASPSLFTDVFSFKDPSTASVLVDRVTVGTPALNISVNEAPADSKDSRFTVGEFKSLREESPIVWDAFMGRSADKATPPPEALLDEADAGIGANVEHGLQGSTFHHARNDLISRLRMDKGVGDISTKLSKSITERVLGEIESGINSALSSAPAFKSLRSVMKKIDRMRSDKTHKSNFANLEELLIQAKSMEKERVDVKNKKNQLDGKPTIKETPAGLKAMFTKLFRAEPHAFQEDWLRAIQKVPKLKEKFSPYLEGYSIATKGGMRSPGLAPKKAESVVDYAMIVKMASSHMFHS